MALNLAVLQRLDAKINQILATAGHVALYKFLPATQAWERKEVEGSLFVVERTEEPLHTIVVLNRISIENFCEPITTGLQMRVSEPYLLLRNYKNETTGVWFYSKDEQHKISQAVRALLDAKASSASSSTSSTTSKKPAKASVDKEKTAAAASTKAPADKAAGADKTSQASSPAPQAAAAGPPGLQQPSAAAAAVPPAVSASTPSPSAGYAPLGGQAAGASILSAVLGGIVAGSTGAGSTPSYAQAVARDSTSSTSSSLLPSVSSSSSPAVAVAAAAPPAVSAPTPAKPEQEPPRDHGSNAAGAALLNLLQPSADRDREPLPPSQQNGSLVQQPHPHPHPHHHLHLQHPHPQFPPHLLHAQQQPVPPHFGQPAPHHLPPMHPGQQHPHQPLLPHHPIMRQPMPPPQQLQQQQQPPHPQQLQQPLVPQQMHHPARSVASKQHLRSVLLSLANDDSFIDMVYECYMTQLAHGASQKTAPS